jgi:fructose transport system ATP-binding protein
MPHLFEVADRTQIRQLGRGLRVTNPKGHQMSNTVALMTSAKAPAAEMAAAVVY